MESSVDRPQIDIEGELFDIESLSDDAQQDIKFIHEQKSLLAHHQREAFRAEVLINHFSERIAHAVQKEPKLTEVKAND